MADINTLMDNTLPQTNRAARSIRKTFTFPATGIASGDNVQLYTVPAGVSLSLHSASLVAGGSLGSAVLTLQVNRSGTRTAVTTGTTAGAASKVSSASLPAVPLDLMPGDIIEAAVSAAGVTVSAAVTFDLLVVQR